MKYQNGGQFASNVKADLLENFGKNINLSSADIAKVWFTTFKLCILLQKPLKTCFSLKTSYKK